MGLSNDTIKKIRGLIIFTVVVVVAGINYRRLVDVAAGPMHIIWPFILGAATAFILNVPTRNIEGHLPVFGEGGRLRRPVSLVVTILLVIGGLFLVIFVVAPQLVRTFLSLQDSVPVFFTGIRNEAERIFTSNPQMLEHMNQLEVDRQEVFQNMVALLKNGVGAMLDITFSTVVSIIGGISSSLIGFIFAIYILLQKGTLGRQMKKVLMAFLLEPVTGRILDIMALAERTFSSFLTGQCVEAVTLGTVFFVALTAIHLPYALLIGVLIAFIALIPIFDAFVGPAVGVFLMLMISPMDALIFTITFFVLQQVEGNLIYSYVVGNSVGLPSIQVLVTMAVGGSMMGVVGMLIFIPLCSVLYALLRDGIDACLRRKGRGESAYEPVCVAVDEENGDQERQE